MIKRINAQETLDIRQRVLWPNKTKEFCIVEADDVANHFGIYDENKLIGVASTFSNENSVRLRKFAVLNEYQGKGCGRKLLKRIIELERENGSEVFWCDARESAVSFYKQFDMEVEGSIFYKSEVPYFKMSVKLQK